jgi:hypothetical protein
LSRLKMGIMLVADRGYEAAPPEILQRIGGGGQSTEEQSPGANLLQPVPLSGPQLDRAVLQSDQTCRRLAIRYDCSPPAISLIQLASSRLWLRVNEDTS